MRIFLVNKQKICHINSVKLKKLAHSFLLQLARLTPDVSYGDLSFILMDDAGITELNLDYLDHAFATDVLTFPYLHNSLTGQIIDAEIIVNIQRALAEGPKHGGASRELALYMAHGCDHLSGLNDDTLNGMHQMRIRELNWLRNARKANLTTSLLITS